MPVFTKVAKVSEVPPGTGKTVDIGGRPVALFNVAGAFHAVDDTCAHMGGPLGEGALEGCAVVCPWHAWSYDLKTGACEVQEGKKVAVHEVRVEGDDVLVSLR